MKLLQRPKFLLSIIVVLIIINLSTFVGVFFARDCKEDENKDKMREAFFQKLQLTEKQRKFFIENRDRIKKVNTVLYDNYDSTIISLQKISATADTSKIRELSDSLGSINSQIRYNWAMYSITVRSCLDSTQKVKYDILALEHLRGKTKR